jgi:hypothetical protein
MYIFVDRRHFRDRNQSAKEATDEELQSIYLTNKPYSSGWGYYPSGLLIGIF